MNAILEEITTHAEMESHIRQSCQSERNDEHTEAVGDGIDLRLVVRLIQQNYHDEYDIGRQIKQLYDASVESVASEQL